MVDTRPPTELGGKRFYDHGASYSPGVKRQKYDPIPNFLRDCHPCFLPQGDLKTAVLAQVNLSRVREKAALTKRGSKLICAPRSKISIPRTIRTVAYPDHDFTSNSRDSFSRDLSPRNGGKESSFPPSKCEAVVNGKSDLVQKPIKRSGRLNVDEEVAWHAECGMFVANDTCKFKQMKVGAEDFGPRTRTSYENGSKQRLSGDGTDTNKLLEPNPPPENKSHSLATEATDAVSRKSRNFLLVNNQSDSLLRVDLDRGKVTKALNLFDDKYNKLYQQCQVRAKLERAYICQIPVKAAGIAKQQLKLFGANEKAIGSIPGIKVGDQFRFRAQLVLVGLHCQYSFGIDYMKKDGKKVAISIVDSGRYGKGKASDQYIREIELPDVFFYSGQGGNPLVRSGTKTGPKELEDQKLEGGNLALINSMERQIPVRVFRKLKRVRGKDQAFSYDGLYVVTNCKQEVGPHGKLIFNFQFNKLHEQPRLLKCLVGTSDKSKLQPGLQVSI